MSGRLFTVSGPSGAGKSSLCAAWLERDPDLALSISCTTRPPRPGDIDGEHYHFLSDEEFRRQVDEGAFLEWAEVHGNCYGTRREDVARLLDEGKDVLLEIDWQGAAQVARQMPEVCRIFVLPPSLDELRRRLVSRGHDSEEVMAARLAAAEEEMTHADEAHHVLVNDDFDHSLDFLMRLSAGAASRDGGGG